VKRTPLGDLTRAGSATAASLILMFAAACDGADDSGTTAKNKPAAEKFAPQPGFDRGNFRAPTNVDNQWFPLKPGAEYTYDGETVEDHLKEQHGIVFTVTDMTKEIDGVRTVVIWERDYKEREVEEAELSFFGQADNGDVWYFGEHPEEYDNGEVVAAPGWIAGYEGASPGIFIEAKPQLGEPSYAQGWAPKVEWTDRSRAYKIGQKTCVPAGCYKNVLVNDEFNKEEPHTYQLKYYAPDVGLVRVEWRGVTEETEKLTLTKIKQLSPKAMADVHGEVMKLEKRAYLTDKTSYGKTSPIEGPGVPPQG
jgi:hypothetical protein